MASKPDAIASFRDASGYFPVGMGGDSIFRDHSDIYPAPPVDVLDFHEAKNAYVMDREAAMMARGEARRAVEAKNEALRAPESELPGAPVIVPDG